MAITPSKGTGISPFGTGAYGYGSPASIPVPGGAPRRDARGVQQNATLLLDPVAPGSQSYAMTPGLPKLRHIFDSFGHRVGAPDVVHMSMLAVATIRGTSIDPSLGQTFADIRKITGSFEQDVRAKVDEAFAQMVDAGLVRVEAVQCKIGSGGRAFNTVTLTDLSTNQLIELSA